MKEILYEEISNHSSERHFKVRRDNYMIIVSGNNAEIYDEESTDKVRYG